MLTRVVARALLTCFAVGCSSDAHGEAESTTLSDVVYVGGTTDEALQMMLDQSAKDVASQHVSFVNLRLQGDAPIA